MRQHPASSIAKPACMNMIRADARMIHLARCNLSGNLFANDAFDHYMEQHVTMQRFPTSEYLSSNYAIQNQPFVTNWIPTRALRRRMRHRSVDAREPSIERRVIPHRLLQAPNCRGHWLGEQQMKRSPEPFMYARSSATLDTSMLLKKLRECYYARRKLKVP